MPLILERNAVVDIYAKAAEKKWVVPTFCSENLTTTEAILAASQEYALEIGQKDVPVSIAITNQYNHRSQSVYYTHTRQWDIGLRLFMADIDVLTSDASPFANLNVMTHLDHTQWDSDAELLQWDMKQFSMIMFDASALPFEENMEKTSRFVEKHGREIVIEGACDEIVDAGGLEKSHLTTPAQAKRYLEATGADYIVANLGTEHRASASELKYHGDLAREIKAATGTKLVLHGTSSVTSDQVKDLFNDGIAKVNIWTILERDSSPVLLDDMVRNAAKVAGGEKVKELRSERLLGEKCDIGNASISHYTTTYRQQIVFEKMKEIVKSYLKLWYV
jgi:fructose/tagatose bisphosphate aldolase